MSFARLLFLGALLQGLTLPAAFSQTMLQKESAVNVGSNPSYIVSGDLNDDGWPDLVTADRGTLSDSRDERPANDEISILIHEGLGEEKKEVSFRKLQPSLKTGFAPYGVALANIDALKWPDIVVVNFMAVRDEDVTLYRNLQQEGIYEEHTFEAPDASLAYHRQTDGDGRGVFTKPGLTAIAVRDLDGDGLRDAVATAWSSDALAIFKGEAQSYFLPPTYVTVTGAPRDLQICDLDGDGALEIVVLCYATGEVAIFKADEDGQWKESKRFPTRGQLPVRLQCADINNDNLLDIVVAHTHAHDSVVIFYNDAATPFSVSQEILLGEDRKTLEHDIKDCAVGDFNGDGQLDLAVTCFASSLVKAILLQQPEEQNALPGVRIEDYSFKDGKPRALCAVDFNKDGKSDIAVTLWDRNTVRFLIAK